MSIKAVGGFFTEKSRGKLQKVAKNFILGG